MQLDERYYCRVCGLEEEEEPPWGEDGMSPTHDACVCCGVEHGYEDARLEGVRHYREQWLANGAKWHDPKFKPANWDLEEQLRHIPEKYR